MSYKPSFDILNYLRSWVAQFAMWFCGCPTLYWTDPAEWEEYMSIGEPYVAADDELTAAGEE